MPPKKKKEEKCKPIEKEKEEDSISKFAELIEYLFEIYKNKRGSITSYVDLELDEIKVDIYVTKKNNLYNYEIVSSNIILDENDENGDDDVILLEKNNFTTIIDMLKDLENVKKTYRFVEHKLLPPKELEFAIIQRSFFTISPDKVCSVCYEPTIEYTRCKHPICFKCRERCIKSNNKKCPICRENNINILPFNLDFRYVVMKDTISV
jgi:hypothetical protein